MTEESHTAASASAASSSDTTYPSLPPRSQQHALQSGFTFWYFNKKKSSAGGDRGSAAENYSENIKKMCTFGTVEEFWCAYAHLTRPNDLPGSINFHLFREGIKPEWEDENNAQGGKWMLRCKKGMASRIWEDCLLAVIGDAFHLGDEICGIVLQTKNGEDVLSVWNRHAQNKEATNRIKHTLIRILELPSGAPLEYRNHDTAMKQALTR